MPRALPATLGRASRALPFAAALLAMAPAGVVHADAPAGRFLYAGDDDWDWASPLGAKEPCKLSRYGAMPWSALDWAEEGLEEVRGVLVGTPPDAKKTMTMEDLSKLRGEKASYRHVQQNAGVFRKLFEGEDAPNVLILMHNTSNGQAPDAASIGELRKFVKNGGRVVVLDDWKRYRGLLAGMMEEALKLPAGPPIPEPPARQPWVEQKKEEPPTDADKDAPDQPAKENPARGEFEQFLPLLGADDFKLREEAHEAIRRLGPGVLELLEEVETDDPEIASRLNKIRRALKPGPSPNKAQLSAARDAQRRAKYEENIAHINEAAARLRDKRIPHILEDVFVDREKRPLPVLRIEFPQ